MSSALDQTVQLLRIIKGRAQGRTYERGVEYHDDDRISDLTKERRGWSGIAHGMNEYDVWIDPQQGMYECNCPAPSPCKHVVALTLVLLDHLSGKDGQRLQASHQIQYKDGDTDDLKTDHRYGHTRTHEPYRAARKKQSGPTPTLVYQFRSGSDRFWIGFRDGTGKEIHPDGIDDLLEWMPHGTLDYYYRQKEHGLSIPYQFEVIHRLVGDHPLYLDDAPVAMADTIPPVFTLDLHGDSGRLSASVELNDEFAAVGGKKVASYLLARESKDGLMMRLGLPAPDQLALLQRTEITHPLKTLLEMLPELRRQKVRGLEALPEIKEHGPLPLLFVDPIVDKDDLVGLQLQFRFAYFSHAIEPERDATPAGLQEAAVFAPFTLSNTPRTNEPIGVSPEGIPAKRNVKSERKIFEPLASMLTQNGSKRIFKGKILTFFHEQLGAYQKAGVVVQMPAELMSLKIRHTQSVFQLQTSSGTDWFDGRIEIPGLSADDMERALAAARNRQSHLLLSDGRWIRLEDLQIDRILQTLDSLGLKNKKDGTVEKISIGQATALLAEQEARTERLGGELRARLLRWAHRDEQASTVRFSVAEGFGAKLRPYQVTGVQFLLERHAAGVGAVLADDMGLGKTVQGLAFLHTLEHQKPGRYLIVCPPGALSVWRLETERFCPKLLLQTWHGTSRKDQFPAERGIMLTTYGTLQKDLELFADLSFETVLIDEAQTLKNHRSAASRSMRSIQSRTFFCLTGTPLENHPFEIWSLMDLILPGLLGTRSSFRSLFGQTLDEDRKDALKRRIAPFILRRTRDAVLKDLPARTEQDLRIPMTQRQALAYERARREAVEALKKAGRDYLMQMLPHLMKLRRIACHPELGDAKADPLESGKILSYAEMADELEETARGILVFSQFTDMLDMFGRFLDARHEGRKGTRRPYLRLDGSTTTAQRERRVREFQEGDVPYFLISLRAGGTALTLHRADTVLHLDPWWNPAVEEQATARAHRMGQKHPVFVYRFFSENSVEEKVAKLQQKKRQLFDDLFGSSQKGAVPFDRDELLALLSSD